MESQILMSDSSNRLLAMHEYHPVPRDMAPQSGALGPTFNEEVIVNDTAVNEVDNDADAPYHCDICGKGFAVLARLQRHHRVHTGEKPFRCEFCNKTFSVKENLNVHRRIHTKERPYECSVCNRAFEHSGKLHRHMRTHTGERPHKCELCGKTFVQSGQLVIHMRAHTGEKPYTCDYCQKGFTCSKQLKVHTRTHTGEKPYECDICGKTFGYNHVLKMHKMSHLGEKLYKCTLCDEFCSSRKALDRHIKEHNEDPFAASQTAPKEAIKETETRITKKVPQNSSTSGGSLVSIPPLCPLSQPVQYIRDTEVHAYRLNSRVSEGDQSESHKEIEVVTPRYAFSGVGGTSLTPLTPPGSPHSPGPPSLHSSDAYKIGPPPMLISLDNCNIEVLKQHWKNSSGKTLLNRSSVPSLVSSEAGTYGSTTSEKQKLAFFTTITGEQLACPVDQVIRIPNSNLKYKMDSKMLQKEFQDTLKIREELEDRLRREEFNHKRETVFCESVMKVLESCIGNDRLQKMGYPKCSIDEIIMNTLKLMGTQPCWEPSLAAMDRIKVNLRLLLECCVPDQELWTKFGWKGKSIEEIVAEFLNHVTA